MANVTYASQNFSTTLNVAGGIDNSQTSGIVLTSVSGLDTNGGVLCFDWADPLDTDSAEYIEYTGVSGNTLTGVSRGVEGLSAKSHSNGATVVAVLSKAHINRINDKINGTDTDGVTLAAASFTTNDPTLATGLNIQVNSADPKRTIVIPAAAWKETTTSGCAAVTTVEAGTNDIDYQVLDFDAASDERAFINFTMPDSYDGGTITAKFVWTAASSSGDVVWGLQGRAYANDDAIDQALGTAQTATDTLTATGDICITSATSAITLAGSPAGGQMVHLRVYRDADAGGDTLAADARLIAVHIEYSQATYSD